MVSKTDSCAGAESQYLYGRNSMPVEACMQMCELEPACDNFVYCTEGDCIGKCELHQGVCTAKGYYTAIRYERRGKDMLYN